MEKLHYVKNITGMYKAVKMKPSDCYHSSVRESEDEYLCKKGVKVPRVVLIPKKTHDAGGWIDDMGVEYSLMCEFIKEDLVEMIEGVFEPISFYADYQNPKPNGLPGILHLPEKAMNKKELEEYLTKKGFVHNPELDKELIDYL